jgi:hypothetical protein
MEARGAQRRRGLPTTDARIARPQAEPLPTGSKRRLATVINPAVLAPHLRGSKLGYRAEAARPVACMFGCIRLSNRSRRRGLLRFSAHSVPPGRPGVKQPLASFLLGKSPVFAHDKGCPLPCRAPEQVAGNSAGPCRPTWRGFSSHPVPSHTFALPVLLVSSDHLKVAPLPFASAARQPLVRRADRTATGHPAAQTEAGRGEQARRSC